MLTLLPSPPLLYEAIWQQKIGIMTKGAETGQVPQPGLDGMQPNPGSGKAEQISSVARDLDDIFRFPLFRTERLLEIILD